MTFPFLNIHIQLDHHEFALQADFQADAESVAVVGPSGAGKSTLLRTIAGLHRPRKGRICVGGKVWFDAQQKIYLPPQQRGAGYVPQNYALFAHLNVRQNIGYGLQRWSQVDKNQRIDQLLTLMQIEELAARRPHQLSGGQQQRVALARALAPKPAILLMDEPLAALDIALRQKLRAEIRALPAKTGVPLLFVTHDVREAYALADRLVILHHGRVVQSGLREEVFRQPASPAVAQALGMTNLFFLDIQTKGEQPVLFWRGLRLNIPCPEGAAGRALAGLRPEDILFLKPERSQNPRPGEIVLPAEVIADEHRGTEHAVQLAMHLPSGDQKMEVVLSHPFFERLGLGIGMKRNVAIRLEQLHIFPQGGNHARNST